MTLLKKILCIGLICSIHSTSYADDNIVMTSTENPSFAIQKIQEQLSKLQAHVYTVLPLDTQEAMSGGSQDPETALKQFDDNKAKAQLGSKLEELRNDMADLRGKLEEATHIIDMQAAKMEKLEQQLAAAQVAPAPTPESATPSPAPNTSTVNTTVVASENVAPILNDTGTVANEIKSLDPKDAYEQSKEYIRQGDYANAEIALKTFVESFPSHELIGSGYYYLGELYYIQQKFKEALSIFAEGYKTQPSGDKAPDTLLKMAQCFDALKQSKEACATLTRLHKAFPRLDSNIKATANKLKTTLKCSGKK